jgi:hypothetical protein
MAQPPVPAPVVQQPRPIAMSVVPGLIHRETYHEPLAKSKEGNRSRFEGYRVFTRWIASDQTFFMVRKFTSLNVRIILSLQDQIVQMEQDLQELDEDWSRDPLPQNITHPDPDIIHNGTFRQDDVDQRTILLDKLAQKVSFYSMFVSALRHFVAKVPIYLQVPFGNQH